MLELFSSGCYIVMEGFLAVRNRIYVDGSEVDKRCDLWDILSRSTSQPATNLLLSQRPINSLLSEVSIFDRLPYSFSSIRAFSRLLRTKDEQNPNQAFG